jgi:hypothetical protein
MYLRMEVPPELRITSTAYDGLVSLASGGWALKPPALVIVAHRSIEWAQIAAASNPSPTAILS